MALGADGAGTAPTARAVGVFGENIRFWLLALLHEVIAAKGKEAVSDYGLAPDLWFEC